MVPAPSRSCSGTQSGGAVDAGGPADTTRVAPLSSIEAIDWPSALKASATMGAVCDHPIRTRCVAQLMTRTSPFSVPIAIASPSGLNASVVGHARWNLAQRQRRLLE